MAPPLADNGEGGSICEDTGAFLYSSVPGDPDTWVRDAGRDLQHGAKHGGFPPLGDKTAHRKPPLAPRGQDM